MVDQIANRATQQVAQLCQRWHLPFEVGSDMAKLGLYDIVLYVGQYLISETDALYSMWLICGADDSGSMQFQENGERIKDLQVILQRVTSAATLFDDDGISVRFMNNNPPSHLIIHIRDEKQVDAVMQAIQYKGLTPMGTELKNKVLDEFVLGKANTGQLQKPVLVIVLTDGQPAGEPQNAIFDTIRNANMELQRSRYGAGAVAFQIAQVGNDVDARKFLEKLDSDPVVGGLVDCTSSTLSLIA